jgi:hypothetical protein
MTAKSGRCLCGAVSFRSAGPWRSVSLCHCKMCCRWHGHTGAYTSVPKSALIFTESRGLAWYHASDVARRGFCRDCGASLFWEACEGEGISIVAGCLDEPTGLTTRVQIYTEDKGDYYDLDTSVPIKKKTIDRAPRKP